MRSETKRGEPGGTKEKKTIGGLGGNLQTTGEVSGLPQTSWSYKNQFFSKNFGNVCWQAKLCHWINIPGPRSQEDGGNKVIQTGKGRAGLSGQEELGQVQALRQRGKKS